MINRVLPGLRQLSSFKLKSNMDFDEPSTRVLTQEFIAVVLSGFGNECVSNQALFHALIRPKQIITSYQ